MADQTDLVAIEHQLTTVIDYKGVEKGNAGGWPDGRSSGAG